VSDGPDDVDAVDETPGDDVAAADKESGAEAAPLVDAEEEAL
jgi:hypothetical protein